MLILQYVTMISEMLLERKKQKFLTQKYSNEVSLELNMITLNQLLHSYELSATEVTFLGTLYRFIKI